jgi:hypothetical protein
MKTQSEQFAETFCHLRDNAKPYTEQDAADLAHVRAPMPPSKAHLKRLARHAQGVRFVQPIPAAKEVTPEVLAMRAQMEFHRLMLSQIGGTRTIAPATQLHWNPDAKKFATHIPASYRAEHEVQPGKAEKEARAESFAETVAKARAEREAKAASDRSSLFNAYSDRMAAAFDESVA